MNVPRRLCREIETLEERGYKVLCAMKDGYVVMKNGELLEGEITERGDFIALDR